MRTVAIMTKAGRREPKSQLRSLLQCEYPPLGEIQHKEDDGRMIIDTFYVDDNEDDRRIQKWVVILNQTHCRTDIQ